jgi:hypothetical protein
VHHHRDKVSIDEQIRIDDSSSKGRRLRQCLAEAEESTAVSVSRVLEYGPEGLTKSRDRAEKSTAELMDELANNSNTCSTDVGFVKIQAKIDPSLPANRRHDRAWQGLLEEAQRAAVDGNRW